MTDTARPEASAADARFEAVAHAALEDLLATRPELATALGDHRYDHRLDDVSPAGLDHERTILSRHLRALDGVDTGALTGTNAVDAEILRNRLALRLFEIDEVREHEWSPLVANPGNAVYSLLARDYAPIDDRLRAAAARLAGVPARLETARRVLGANPMPRVHVETALTQLGGAAHMIEAEIDAALEDAPGRRREIDAVRPAALEAIEAHRAWLRDQLEGATRDPRIGPDLYARKLALTLDTETTAGGVRARAEADLERIAATMDEIAARLGGAGASPKDVLDRLADDHPDDATIVRLCQASVGEATQFVRDHDLVTLPDTECEVIVMPEIRRGVAVAYCDSPGPLEEAPLPTFFAVAPTPEDWPPERVESFYREYNAHMVHDLTVHEAVPGHFLQIWHSRRFRGATKVRTAFRSGVFAEGWGVFSEELMAERGYQGDAVRMQQLKMQLRCTINAILDSAVHADAMTEDAAMALMMGKGHQEEGEAAGKWRRALLTSAQLSTYYVGYVEVRDAVARLRAARPGASDRAVHDEFLSHGSPPPRHFDALLNLA